MGKTGAFITTARKAAPERPLTEQVQDFEEFHQLFTKADLREQASRCMDCGVPFCHVAQTIEGASVGCPLGNLIPEVNDLAYQGRFAEALDRLHLTNPFPEFTGRVCPAVCEGSCVLGEHKPPVTIKEIERYVAEQGGVDIDATENSPQTGANSSPTVTAASAQRVAVIGSGPAGLAAADALNRRGIAVTVFEGARRAGGLLTYGIPNMKLDKSVVQATVERMAAAGVTFKLSCKVNEGNAAQIKADFDAVILCGGARAPRMPKINPEHLAGFYPAMRYLTYTTQRLLGETDYEAALEAEGKHVIVVGNGDTATDCVATAVRQKAASIAQLYYRARPSATRSESQPWPLYPKLFKTEYGQAEAAFVYGQDPREFSVNPTALIGGEAGSPDAGRVVAIKTQQTSWQMVDGKNTMSYVTGSEQTRPADLVLIATGFTGPTPELPAAFGVKQDRRTNVATAAGHYATDVTGVFTAGDMHRGQSLVVHAIHEGLAAAAECAAWLAAR
ncbi:MAG: glutamate synthase subunit beta [Coriobacteriales bacterium]|jgi:glutamate synthase (NADPH/NADH) small chain|nr:glutamate synthase subunit beta [Coriobacteriales bacterium]